MKWLRVLPCLFLLSFCCSGQSVPGKPGQPNFVLFIADDLGVKDIGPYGNTVVRTPHLQRLAQESLLFNQAFAASPTCGPSRSSLFTGLMPLRHGAHGNHSGVKSGTRSVAQYLSALGYKVAIAGKLHVGPEDVFPFERIAGTNVREPGYEKVPGLYHDLNLEPVDKWLTGRAEGQPFVLIVADHSPHVIWPEKPAYRREEVDIPPVHIDTPETRKARARYYTDITKMDANVGKVLDMLRRRDLEKNTVFMFTSDQGPQWAFGKWNVYDYGVRVPLLVRWPNHITVPASTRALVSHVDILPTMIEIAGGTPSPELDGTSFLRVLKNPLLKHREMLFASHTGDREMNRTPMRMLRTDRYKYILNLAPGEIYNTHMNLAKDHDGGREYWPSWLTESFRNAHAASVLWRYHRRPAEELYDTLNDPWEQHNLAADESYRPMLERFGKHLAGWRARQGDDKTGPEDHEPPAPSRQPVAPYVF
ncbi:MAG: hypothetical protein ABS46_13495 [Cytophagaceae bacterium SCN 52-12]|nr:MAG: hypothetical protein ABS46_13495 [Cytophagaceae bacterium SCN 52-12]